MMRDRRFGWSWSNGIFQAVITDWTPAKLSSTCFGCCQIIVIVKSPRWKIASSSVPGMIHGKVVLGYWGTNAGFPARWFWLYWNLWFVLILFLKWLGNLDFLSSIWKRDIEIITSAERGTAWGEIESLLWGWLTVNSFWFGQDTVLRLDWRRCCRLVAGWILLDPLELVPPFIPGGTSIFWLITCRSESWEKFKIYWGT